MYIVRKGKGEATDGDNFDSQSPLDKETMINIKGLMDDHVFDLLDKTETRVLQLQRDNMELLEELSHFY